MGLTKLANENELGDKAVPYKQIVGGEPINQRPNVACLSIAIETDSLASSGNRGLATNG